MAEAGEDPTSLVACRVVAHQRYVVGRAPRSLLLAMLKTLGFDWCPSGPCQRPGQSSIHLPRHGVQ